MYKNYVFSDATEALPNLLFDLLHTGEEVSSRAGRVKELTHVGITLTHPWRREILVEHRKPSIAAQICETMWVLAGRDDIEWLANYLPRVYDFSDDGKRWRAGYGRRLRGWPRREGLATTPIDQIRYVVETLRRDPLSRQAVATIWDPQIDTNPGKDLPCNDLLMFSSRLGKLDLHVAIRSNDAMWGWSGINAFEWSALQEIVAGLLGIEVGGLHFSTTSFHLYDRHWVKAERIVEKWERSAYPTLADSPRFDGRAVGRSLERFDELAERWFQLEYEIRSGAPVDEQTVNLFPEPMLRSWLRVLQWWWSGGDTSYLTRLKGTNLEAATWQSVQPKQEETGKDGKFAPVGEEKEAVSEDYNPSDFLSQLCSLHLEKEAAYGGSWKRRGEMLGILANIARKVDRLGNGETADETSADTAGDLFVYLAKYRTWLADQGCGGTPITGYPVGTLANSAEYANVVMMQVEQELEFRPLIASEARNLEEQLTKSFDRLEDEAMRKDQLRYETVDGMMGEAYLLARTLWEQEQQAAQKQFEDWDRALTSGGDEYRGADAD